MAWCERWAIGCGILIALVWLVIAGKSGWDEIPMLSFGGAAILWVAFRALDFMIGGYKIRRNY